MVLCSQNSDCLVGMGELETKTHKGPFHELDSTLYVFILLKNNSLICKMWSGYD